MPQKSNHDFKGKYPYIRVCALVGIHDQNIIFCRGAAILGYEKRI